MFYKLNKIIGPTIHDENLLMLYNSDSSLFYYNDNDRVSKIIYYTTYSNTPSNTISKISFEENFSYDSKGRIQEITNNSPSWLMIEKRISFYYNSFNEIAEAHLILNTSADESDSIVYSYAYGRAPYVAPVFVNGEEIRKEVSATRKNYSKGFNVEFYLYPQAHSWRLNKNNISMETRSNVKRVGDFSNYLDLFRVKDSSISEFERYITPESYQNYKKKYVRSNIPNIHFQVCKNIFQNNTWLSNVGSFSPYHGDYVSNFITKSESTIPIKEINHTYIIDSVKNIIVENLNDQYGNFLLKKSYHFSN